MGDIRVHEFISLDGVIDTPTWTVEFGFDPKMGEAIARAMANCDGILLGRRTYEMFEPAWSTRTADDDPGAPFFNDTEKYIVSSTLSAPSWRNSQVIGPYSAETIRALKASSEGDLYISGSGTLVRALLQDSLVDELHLCLYPVTRGSGPRLFSDGVAPSSWSMLTCENYDNGVAFMSYRLKN